MESIHSYVPALMVLLVKPVVILSVDALQTDVRMEERALWQETHLYAAVFRGLLG